MRYNPMDKNLIKSATDKLGILDVVLHESALARNNQFDPIALIGMNIGQQSRMGFRAEKVVYNEEDNPKKLFRVYVDFGVRAVNMDKEGKAPDNIENEEDVLFTIEATYRVDYSFEDDLSEKEAEEFSNYNSVHNAWPFWRMYVFNTLKLAGLPQLNIPLQMLDRG